MKNSHSIILSSKFRLGGVTDLQRLAAGNVSTSTRYPCVAAIERRKARDWVNHLRRGRLEHALKVEFELVAKVRARLCSTRAVKMWRSPQAEEGSPASGEFSIEVFQALIVSRAL